MARTVEAAEKTEEWMRKINAPTSPAGRACWARRASRPGARLALLVAVLVMLSGCGEGVPSNDSAANDSAAVAEPPTAQVVDSPAALSSEQQAAAKVAASEPGTGREAATAPTPPPPAPTESVMAPPAPPEAGPTSSGTTVPAAGSNSPEAPPTQSTETTPTLPIRRFSPAALLIAFALIGLIGLLALLAVAWLVIRRRPPPPGSPAAPPSPGGWQASPPPPGTPYLEGVDSSGAPVYIGLPQPVSVAGRAAGLEIPIDARFAEHDTVSERHARFERGAGAVVVVDLQSTNGVYVNGRRTGVCKLADGIAIGLGPRVRLTFHGNDQRGIQ